MKHLSRMNNELYVEAVPLKRIAELVGTPSYVYSATAITEAWQQFQNALQSHPETKFDTQINYAVKANSNLSILKLLANLGSGFDIVSQGELERVLQAGGNPKKMVFSGVGKSSGEIQRALEIGIGCINVESRSELLRIQDLAKKLNRPVNISVRVNPDVDPDSHPYISTGLKENKFGIPISQAKDLFMEGASFSHLNMRGIAFHIGSQVTSLFPFQSALKKILRLIDELEALQIPIFDLNVGGGLGVRYQDETPPKPDEYVATILMGIEQHRHQNKRSLKIHLEPGRAIVANAGLLLTRVEYIKEKSKDEVPNAHYFAIVDAAMNDLIRPTLYSVWHDIVPVSSHSSPLDSPHSSSNSHNPSHKTEISTRYDIVGPVCETGDFLGKDRLLDLKEGDLLAVLGAGAYGFSMSSNYNSRPRPAEVLVTEDKFRIVRSRESFEELFRAELKSQT